MSTAEKIYQTALALPEPAQAAVLHVIEVLAQNSTSKAATESPLSQEEIAELRARLAGWEQDWTAPGMEAYDRP